VCLCVCVRVLRTSPPTQHFLLPPAWVRVGLRAAAPVQVRLSGAAKAATGGRSFAGLVERADGPGGMPLEDPEDYGGSGGGSASGGGGGGESSRCGGGSSGGGGGGGGGGGDGAGLVPAAVRHRIRKDLRRSRCNAVFEEELDPDPVSGLLYHVLVAYAALDPEVR